MEVEKKGDVNIEAMPKFEDATSVGGVDSLQCTLIITEEDSAKSLAVSNISLWFHIHLLFQIWYQFVILDLIAHMCWLLI